MRLSGAGLTERQTEHGLLIAFGEFARHTGLIAGLMRVRIPQKIQRHTRAVPRRPNWSSYMPVCSPGSSISRT